MGLGVDTLKKGDWVVHAYYGIGEVIGKDTKIIDEIKQTYYRVKTENSTYWLPTDNLNVSHIRPVASLYKIRKAVSELKKKPSEMARDYKVRNKRIRDAFAEGTVLSFARLLRDLTWRKFSAQLNEKERDVVDVLRDRISQEWSLAAGIAMDEAVNKLDSILIKEIAGRSNAK